MPTIKSPASGEVCTKETNAAGIFPFCVLSSSLRHALSDRSRQQLKTVYNNLFLLFNNKVCMFMRVNTRCSDSPSYSELVNEWGDVSATVFIKIIYRGVFVQKNP